MGIPPAYLMLVGSTLEAVGFSALLGLMVWVCQQVLHSRRAIAVEFISELLTGIFVAFLASTGLPIPVWALCIASIVLFVPGLSIANALECLAFNDLRLGYQFARAECLNADQAVCWNYHGSQYW